MNRRWWTIAAVIIVASAGWVLYASGVKIDPKDLHTFGDAPSLMPGTYHKIKDQILARQR